MQLSTLDIFSLEQCNEADNSIGISIIEINEAYIKLKVTINSDDKSYSEEIIKAEWMDEI